MHLPGLVILFFVTIILNLSCDSRRIHTRPLFIFSEHLFHRAVSKYQERFVFVEPVNSLESDLRYRDITPYRRQADARRGIHPLGRV